LLRLSGTFLVEIVSRIKLRGKNRNPNLLLADIEQNVFGVDIHPLAVAMARVNFIIAVSPLLRRGEKFAVPIYWADSLLRLSVEGKSRKWEVMGQPIDISIPGMQTFHLPDPEKFDWEKLFNFARQHIAGIRGKVAVDKVWKRFTQDFPPEQVAAFEQALATAAHQIATGLRAYLCSWCDAWHLTKNAVRTGKDRG